MGTTVYTKVSGSSSDANTKAAAYGSSLRSAISAYKRGLRTRPPIISGIGDSNFTGEGAGIGTGTVPKLTQAFDKGPMEKISTWAPTMAGLVVRNTSWFGEGNSNNNATPVMEYNPRITLGTDWTRTTGSTMFALGGSHMVGAPASAGYFQYAFGSAITNVEIYMVVNPTNSNSVGVYNSANTLITTLNTNGTAAAAVFSVSGAFTDGIVKVKNNGANNCYIAGMIAWNSSEKSIIVTRHSFSAAVTADFAAATNVWDGMGYYPLIKPDCAILALTINDINAGTTRSTYNTNLAYIADFVARYGDLIISTGGNGSGANYLNTVYVGIEAEAKKVAGLYGAPFVSIHKEWASWAATNALGWEFDSNHRKAAGYLDQARVYADVLSAMVGT